MNVLDMKLADDEYQWIDGWMQLFGAWVYSGRLDRRMSSVISRFMDNADPSRAMPTRPMCSDEDGLLISKVVDRVIAPVDERALGILFSYYALGSSEYAIASYYHRVSAPRKMETGRGGRGWRKPSINTCRNEVKASIDASLWIIYQELHPLMMDKHRNAYAMRMKKCKRIGINSY